MKLDEIEKLIEAASPGPWEHRDNCEVMTTEMLRHCVASCGPKRDFSFGNSSSMANAAFIAASRTLMPRLLKVVRAVQGIDFVVQRLHAEGGNDSFESSASVSIAKMNNILTALTELEQP